MKNVSNLLEHHSIGIAQRETHPGSFSPPRKLHPDLDGIYPSHVSAFSRCQLKLGQPYLKDGKREPPSYRHHHQLLHTRLAGRSINCAPGGIIYRSSLQPRRWASWPGLPVRFLRTYWFIAGNLWFYPAQLVLAGARYGDNNWQTDLEQGVKRESTYGEIREYRETSASKRTRNV